MTPQTQLTLSQLFEGKEIRVVEQSEDFWMIVSDISKAWELHRNTLNELIDRNEWKFGGHYTTVAHGACAGMTAVNETGMYLLMGAVHINLVKNEKSKAAIKKFNELWPDLVKSFRKGEVVQAPVVLQSPIDIINERLDLADIAVKRSGVPKEIAHSMAWAVVDTKEISTSMAGYIKAQSTQLQLIEAEPVDREEFNKLHSRRDIARMMKLSEDKVRNVLESIGIIYFEHGIWKLTTKGQQFGKAFLVNDFGYPYRTNQKAWIRYNELCIDLLKKYFDIQLPVAKVE
jgi:prophage antirepressor-like protein